MALPTPDDLKTMDTSYEGQPFVYIAGNSNVDTFTMDWAYEGQPFVVVKTTVTDTFIPIIIFM